jgi:hypothetical protein
MSEQFSRQSFLGPRAEDLLGTATVAIVGLGGGGSHVAQQLAHVGVGNLSLFDPDRVEWSNLNRLVGATAADAHNGAMKVDIARRLVLGIHPGVNVGAHAVQWQLAAEVIREADIVVGCMDSYAARQDLEVTTRRFLMPLVDIGMDVHVVGEQPHMSGQVIVTLPGGPCLRCLGFLTDENLRHEAQLYGAAGGRPQVVWANGVLASMAVGLVVELLTGWRGRQFAAEYLHYDANEYTISRSPRVEYAPKECRHFQGDSVGEPTL